MVIMANGLNIFIQGDYGYLSRYLSERIIDFINVWLVSVFKTLFVFKEINYGHGCLSHPKASMGVAKPPSRAYRVAESPILT